MANRGSKYFWGISSIAVIAGSSFLASRQALREATQAPNLSPVSSEVDAALHFLVTPSPVEKLIESLIDNRLLLMTKIESDLNMRASSIGDLMNRIHMLKLNMMFNPTRNDFSQLIEQHNELVKLYHHELSQHQKKHAEYEKVIDQIHLILTLYFKKQKENDAI